MGRWRRVMWCSVCMPRECVLIISSRAWWWCGAGRAGGLSFSRSLRRRAARQGVGVSPGSGARGAQEGRRRVGGRITRKWCAGSEVAAGRPLGGRRSLLLRRPGLALCGDARAPKSIVRSLLPPASCLLPPAPTTRLAGGLCGERAPKSFLVRSPFSCPPRVLAGCHPEVRPPE